MVKQVNTMDMQMKSNELLSALADGELKGEELANALRLCGDPQARGAWHAYHVIGDVLRSPALAPAEDGERFLARFREQLSRESRAAAVPPVVLEPRVESGHEAAAANDPVFRWKLAAGFASLAAVAAIGWSSFTALQSEGISGPQLAAAQPAAGVPASVEAASVQLAPAQPVEVAQGGPQVMIRDPRLDELLAAHKRFGGASALQLPAGFLRNATFEAPQR